ncbi:MAG: LysM domain-containing protein, partial [Chloroflexota bacterium]
MKKLNTPPNSRQVAEKQTPILLKLKTRLKDPKQLFVFCLLIIAIGIVPFASALTHTVVEGDTLWDLAIKYDTTIEQIAVDNNIADVNLIREGQTLKINETSDEMTDYSSSTSLDGNALKAALDVQFNIDSISPTSD